MLVQFRRAGTVGRFSFSVMLTSIVLGAGTLSLAQILLDVVWMYLYPLLGLHTNEHITDTIFEKVEDGNPSKKNRIDIDSRHETPIQRRAMDGQQMAAEAADEEEKRTKSR